MERPKLFLLLICATMTMTITFSSFVVTTTAISTTISDPSSVSTAATTTKRPQYTTSANESNPTEQEVMPNNKNSSSTSLSSSPTRQQSVKRERNRKTQPGNGAAISKSGHDNDSNRSSSNSRTTAKQAANSSSVDPFAFAQEQARLMSKYTNTPPLFVTGTRDYFVDVVLHPLGTRIATIQVLDADGDKIEFSLQAANLHDASAYFSIELNTGELRLANKHFVFYSDPSPVAQSRRKSPAPTTNITNKRAVENSDEDDDDEDSDDNNDNSEDNNKKREDEETIDSEVMNKNLYFLNVGAHDGNYLSILELKIHVINSSSLASLQSISGGLPVQLIPGGSRTDIHRMENIIRKKTNEFYDNLYKVSQNNHSSSTNSSPIVVYPNFVNPSIVKPDSAKSLQTHQHQDLVVTAPDQQQLYQDKVSSNPTSSPIFAIQTTNTNGPSRNILKSTSGQPERIILATQQQVDTRGGGGEPPAELFNNRPMGGLEPDLMPQPMIVSLVIVCSCLMIASVLLMFIVPLSVKRLRKRLKHVELQNEHLSQQNRSSSTVCSSSTTSSMANHRHSHLPSLSHFTLGSDRSCTTGGSSVCRQSSLDSTVTSIMPPAPHDHHHHQHQMFAPHSRQPLNRVNNGLIANPVYLQEHHQQARLLVGNCGDDLFQQQHIHHVQHLQNSHLSNKYRNQPVTGQVDNVCDNIYYPIDDDCYSTINTESTALDNLQCPSNEPFGSTIVATGQKPGIHAADNNNHAHTYLMAQCPQPELAAEPERLIESPSSDSGSSTRSLARFLSLPIRHHVQQQQQPVNTTKTTTKEQTDEKFANQQFDLGKQTVLSKTIARTSNIHREQSSSSNQQHVWELERHKLKFLDILDEGQFGLVWRCKLKRDNDRQEEQTVAVKTLKSSASKDERGRQELLAEIEIMKLVCHHPNVVKILHCCTSDVVQFNSIDKNSSALTMDPTSKPILLVMEYVELGKLQKFLEKSRVNHHYATSHYNTSPDHLTSSDLIKFIYHVAKGMEYISSQCIVHRDLASRNILVNAHRICKIGDFGMARHMQSLGDVYERHSRNTKVPVRWMAPEVLLNNRFTTKSDVFSFGILMWEIVTLGSTPYRYLETGQVIEAVARNGERPGKPEYCHSELYKIMSKCWSHEPDDRPTFRNLVKQFDELLMKDNDYIKLDQYPDHNYYNIPKNEAPDELL